MKKIELALKDIHEDVSSLQNRLADLVQLLKEAGFLEDKAAVIKDQTLSDARLMTFTQASKYLGLPKNRLASWRYMGINHIPSLKIGRLVKYRKEDLDTFKKNNPKYY